MDIKLRGSGSQAMLKQLRPFTPQQITPPAQIRYATVLADFIMLPMFNSDILVGRVASCELAGAVRAVPQRRSLRPPAARTLYPDFSSPTQPRSKGRRS